MSDTNIPMQNFDLYITQSLCPIKFCKSYINNIRYYLIISLQPGRQKITYCSQALNVDDLQSVADTYIWEIITGFVRKILLIAAFVLPCV